MQRRYSITHTMKTHQEPKYKVRFDSVIYASNVKELDYHSSASLDSLKEVLPYDIDLSKNIDLIPVAFDAAVINEFNNNDDGISASTANSIKKYFIHKPTNIEHDRSRIIGHITNAVFTKKDSHEYIYGEDAVRMDEPFNLSLGGIVYKLIDEEFTDILYNALNSESKSTKVISASWELGFNTFGIAIGGQKLKDCEAITDPIKVASLAPHLKYFGGNGFAPDGQRIYRLIIGDVYPLGIGFTENPAANVNGVYTNDPFKIYAGDGVLDEEGRKEEVLNIDKPYEISQSENLNVKTHDQKTKLMDFIEQIKAALDEYGVGKISDEAKAGMTKDIVDAVREANDQYVAEKQAAEDAKNAAETQAKTLQASVDELKIKLEATESQLKVLQDAAEEEAIATARDQRMEEIDQQFQLDDEDRKLVLSDLADFDPRSNEKFDSYASRLKVLWKDKDKEVIASKQKQIDDQVQAKVQEELAKLNTSNASEKVDDKDGAKAAEDATASAKADGEVVVNKSDASKTEQTLQEKYATHFKEEDIQVTF